MKYNPQVKTLADKISTRTKVDYAHVRVTDLREAIKNLKWNLWEIAWVNDQEVDNKLIQEAINEVFGKGLTEEAQEK